MVLVLTPRGSQKKLMGRMNFRNSEDANLVAWICMLAFSADDLEPLHSATAYRNKTDAESILCGILGSIPAIDYVSQHCAVSVYLIFVCNV